MGRRKGGLSFYRKKKKISSTAIREIAEWFFLVFTAVLIATVLVLSIGMRTSVIGVSMEPGLYNGQEILINHFIYKLVSPKRGDVIVFTEWKPEYPLLCKTGGGAAGRNGTNTK